MLKENAGQVRRAGNFLREVCLGAVVSVLLSMVLLFAAAYLLVSGNLDESQMQPAVWVSAALGTLAATTGAARRLESRKTVGALATGAIICLIMLSVRQLWQLNCDEYAVRVPILVEVCALLGGLSGSKRRKKRKTGKKGSAGQKRGTK